MKERQISTTIHPMCFLMVLASDGKTPAEGLSPTVTISKDGGSFAAPAGAVTEISDGWYALAGNATDRNTLGELLIHAEAATADPTDDRYMIVSYDPFAVTLDGVEAFNTEIPETPTTDSPYDKLANLATDEDIVAAVEGSTAGLVSRALNEGTKTEETVGGVTTVEFTRTADEVTTTVTFTIQADGTRTTVISIV